MFQIDAAFEHPYIIVPDLCHCPNQSDTVDDLFCLSLSLFLLLLLLPRSVGTVGSYLSAPECRFPRTVFVVAVFAAVAIFAVVVVVFAIAIVAVVALDVLVDGLGLFMLRAVTTSGAGPGPTCTKLLIF